MKKEKDISTQYETALEIKQSGKYDNAIKKELIKPEWRQELSEIDERLKVITSTEKFDECKNKLSELFKKVFEKITAPGLDSFVGWIRDNSGPSDNIERLRDFLLNNYESYSTEVDTFLSAKERLPQEEKRLFGKLISNFKKGVKSDVNKFIDDPEKFENNIEAFLSKLEKEYANFAEIEELGYVSISELYSDSQKTRTDVNFYERIIQKAVEKSQELSPISDSEMRMSLADRATSRIKSVRKCIETLIDTSVADQEDEGLRALFLRYEKTMLNTDGEEKDIAKILSNYIEKTWSSIEKKYMAIKDFYRENTLSFNEKEWEGFEKEADITALVQEYDDIQNGNVLPRVQNENIKDVENIIDKCHSKIKKLIDKENSTGKDIKDYFEELISTYKDKKPLLDRLIEVHTELKSQYDTIFEQGKCMTTITNGIDSINKEGLIKSLRDGTVVDMISDMNKVKSVFLDILKQSKMQDEIKWIDDLGAHGEITESNFNEKYLRSLLKNGLITLSFKRNF